MHRGTFCTLSKPVLDVPRVSVPLMTMAFANTNSIFYYVYLMDNYVALYILRTLGAIIAGLGLLMVFAAMQSQLSEKLSGNNFHIGIHAQAIGGVYVLVRHPAYIGSAVMFFGNALFDGEMVFIPVSLVVLGFLSLTSWIADRAKVKAGSPAIIHYIQTTPRFFPSVNAWRLFWMGRSVPSKGLPVRLSAIDADADHVVELSDTMTGLEDQHPSEPYVWQQDERSLLGPPTRSPHSKHGLSPRGMRPAQDGQPRGESSDSFA